MTLLLRIHELHNIRAAMYAPPNCPTSQLSMDAADVLKPEVMTEKRSTSRNWAPYVPTEVTDSVSYAKVSSDYLIGQAASIQHLDTDIRRHSLICFRDSEATSPSGADHLSYASLTLEQARRSLWNDFRRFRSDSSSWARFLKNGDERDFEGGGRPAVYLKQALETVDAVNRARMEVRSACGEMFYESSTAA